MYETGYAICTFITVLSASLGGHHEAPDIAVDISELVMLSEPQAPRIEL